MRHPGGKELMYASAGDPINSATVLSHVTANTAHRIEIRSHDVSARGVRQLRRRLGDLPERGWESAIRGSVPGRPAYMWEAAMCGPVLLAELCGPDRCQIVKMAGAAVDCHPELATDLWETNLALNGHHPQSISEPSIPWLLVKWTDAMKDHLDAVVPLHEFEKLLGWAALVGLKRTV